MRFILVVSIICIFSISLSSAFFQSIFHRNKLNRTAFLTIAKNPLLKLIFPQAKRKVNEDSVFQRLQQAYFNKQQTYYTEARSLSGGIQDGIDEVVSACASCKGNALGRERTQCYASCMTREMNTFAPYALLIGEAVHNFFCVPLGFGFETDYSNKYPAWLSNFQEFVDMFNESQEIFSKSALIEAWLSNLLWLEKSPLYLHSYIRSQVALDIANLQNSNSGTNAAASSDDGLETPSKFADKCGTKWDLQEPVYSLINAARQKSHFLEVILRGLFTVQSATFYTLGNYQNLAGGIMEALGALIGRKCNVISYSEGEDESDDTCDGIGKHPLPQFPIPLIFTKLVLPCESDLIMSAF